MGIFSWLVLGALAGWVGSIIMDKNSSMGLFKNIGVGIIGSFIGGFVMNLLGGKGISGFNLSSFLVALLGSVILLGLMNFISKGKIK